MVITVLNRSKLNRNMMTTVLNRTKLNNLSL